MSLLEKIRTIKVNIKNIKKSIYFPERVDLFLVIALLILIASPFLVNFYLKKNIELHQIKLLLSADCEGLFGKEMTEKLVFDFNEANPDIRIQMFYQPDEKSREPDIYIFNESEYKDLVSAGALSGLNQYIDYYSNTVIYAVPLVSFMDMLFYNIELLSAAGYDRPPKTREEFLSYSKAVSSRSNARRPIAPGAALGFNAGDKQALSRDIFSWIWAAGGDFFPEGDGPVLNFRALTGDLAFFSSLYKESAPAAGVFETTGDQRLEDFSRGRLSMIIDSTRVIPFLREKMGDNAFGVTLIPSNSTAKYNICLSGIYAGIKAHCGYPREAWNFIEFLLGQNQFFNETFKPVYGVTSYIPPDKYITDDPFYSKARDIFESSGIVSGFSGNPSAGEYESAFIEEFEFFLTGGKPAQEAITAIQQRWNVISGM
jgi:ABC-type glycerol-3-phosphate transport system substrate-binding protein